MATVDANIPLQVQPIQLPDQLAQYGRVLQLKGLQDQQQLQDMQLKSAQADEADNARLKQLFSTVKPGQDGSYDLQSIAPQAMAISPKMGGAMVKQFGELNTQALAQAKAKTELGLQHLDIASRVASSITDDQSYQAAIPELQKLGVDVSQFPPTYSPGFVALKMKEGLSLKDQLEQQHKAISLAETQRHNKADEGLKGQSNAIAQSRAAQDAAQAESGKIPPGYRRTETGDLQAIPGGPADLKLQGAFNQDTAALNGSMNSFDRLAESANEVLKHPGLAGITGIRGAIPNIPGGEAADAQAKLNTLKSQVGFGVLQDMRNNSKTGGALGAVSDAEGKRLEANLAALENAQSEKQFKESLQKIITYSQEAKDRLNNAYNLKHGNQNYGGNKPSSAPAPISSDADYNALPSGAEFIAPDGSHRRKP